MRNWLSTAHRQVSDGSCVRHEADQSGQEAGFCRIRKTRWWFLAGLSEIIGKRMNSTLNCSFHRNLNILGRSEVPGRAASLRQGQHSGHRHEENPRKVLTDSISFWLWLWPLSDEIRIIATSSHRWPLPIDPQGTCSHKSNRIRWGVKLNLKFRARPEEIESNNHVQVARYDDEHKYLQALTKSIVNGNTLIITNVEGVLDPELGNLFKKKSPHSGTWHFVFEIPQKMFWQRRLRGSMTRTRSRWGRRLWSVLRTDRTDRTSVNFAKNSIDIFFALITSAN